MDSDIGVPIGAQVKVTQSGRQLLVDDDGKVTASISNTTHRAAWTGNTEGMSMSTGAASDSGVGGVPQGHAPDLSGVRGRHDPAGGPD